MATIPRKRGDTALALLYRVRIAGAPFDFSDPKWIVKASSARDSDGVVMYEERKIDAYSRANADPTSGEVDLPLWDGRTGYGAFSAAVNVVNNAVDGKISVEVAKAAGVDTIDQALYMSKAGEHLTGPWYLVASGVNGFADSGMGGAAQIVSVADAALEDGPVAHADAQDVTQGGVALPAPGTPTAALAGAGAGLVTNGNHSFVAVNKRASDTDVVGIYRLELVLVNSATGGAASWPPSGFEYLQVTEDI